MAQSANNLIGLANSLDRLLSRSQEPGLEWPFGMRGHSPLPPASAIHLLHTAEAVVAVVWPVMIVTSKAHVI